MASLKEGELTPKQLADLAERVKTDAETFHCEFAESIPEDVQTDCSICLQTLREPYIVGCCGHRFCKRCIVPAKEQSPYCPLCKCFNFGMLPDRWLERLLGQKKVYCLLLDNGCTWTGELNKLSDHLNFDEDKASSSLVSCSGKINTCQYLPVPCSYCKVHVRRIDIESHKIICNLRPACKYCDFKGPFQNLCLHYKLCLNFPIQCRNTSCSKDMKRRELGSHLANDCLWEVVTCEYEYAGCDVRVIRKQRPSHMDINKQAHLDLVSKKCKEEMREKATLSDRCLQLEAVLETLGDNLAELQLSCSENEKSLQQQNETDIRYLVVTNVPDNASEHNRLKSRFGQYGSVTCIDMLEDRESAIIEYSSITEYRRAVEASRSPGINLLQHRLHVYPIYDNP